MKNKKIVTLLVGALIGGLVLVPGIKHSQSQNKVLLAGAGSWVQSGSAWYYNEGNTNVTGWQVINGSWYHFDSTGLMQTGWQQINGSWYYMNSSGAMQTGWIYVNGTWYDTNSSGQLQTGWFFVNGEWYCSDSSGAIETGWINQGNNWYDMNSSGAMQTGWVYTDNHWQYLNESGAMQTGWFEINNTWYYANESGTMETGWIMTSGNVHYLDASGAMATGWNNINGISYYFDGNGVQLKGWQYISNEWYYIGKTGKFTGWNQIKGKMYYFEKSGVLQDTVDNKAYTKVQYDMKMDKYVAGEVKQYVAAVGAKNITKTQLAGLKDKISNAVNPEAAKDMYQFLNVGHYRNVNVATLNKMLDGKGVFSGQGQAFADAAKKNNIDPVYFVAQSILETGWGKSSFAEGITITKTYKITDGKTVTLDKTLAKPVKVYNLFGIGAFDQAPTKGGTSYAYNHGWTSVPKAIEGAAKFLSTEYVHNNNIAQNTPYELRYINGTTGQMWHQYSSDITYASEIGAIMNQLSSVYSANNIFTFDIPNFEK